MILYLKKIMFSMRGSDSSLNSFRFMFRSLQCPAVCDLPGNRANFRAFNGFPTLESCFYSFMLFVLFDVGGEMDCWWWSDVVFCSGIL